MTDHAPLGSTRPSNRLTHGLRSRSRTEARQYEAHELTMLLSRPAPDCPLVHAAAADVADAVLHLNDVQDALLALLSPASREADGGAAVVDGDQDLLSCVRCMTLKDHELRRLMTYERKVLSRRNKAINRLDYAILEARRREQAARTEHRALLGKLDLADFR